jgi:hypothetical protein
MSKKQFIIILGLFIVIGGYGLIRYQGESASRQKAGSAPGENVLGNLSVNDIARIRIKQAQGELNLHKKGDIWTVAEREDYPANFSQISEFLLKMKDLRAIQSIQVGASQRGRLEVEEPGKAGKTGTLVEFLDALEKPVRRFILGKSHTHGGAEASPMGEGGYPDGRFVLPSLDSDHVVVVSDPLSSAEPKPEQWLDKDFVKVEKPSSIALESSVATNSWKVSRETETGEWKLDAPKPGEQLDASKVTSFNYSLSNPTFADLATNSAYASSNLATGLHLALTTFDHFTYDLTVATNTGENFYVSAKVSADLPKERTPGKDEKPADKTKLDKEFADKLKAWQEKLKKEKSYEKWVYQISKWTIEPLLKERGQLLVEKKPEPKPGDTNAPPVAPAISVPLPAK